MAVASVAGGRASVPTSLIRFHDDYFVQGIPSEPDPSIAAGSRRPTSCDVVNDEVVSDERIACSAATLSSSSDSDAFENYGRGRC